jgi:DeoR family fructose operon transcriptional repressor
MPNTQRLDQIVALVDERGFLSVRELSELCQVSEMTIRRDLGFLGEQNRLQRTYGGAASLRQKSPGLPGLTSAEIDKKPTSYLLDRVDALVATVVNPEYDEQVLEIVGKKNIPIIAESLMVHNAKTVVAVDNYQAGFDLGCWAGEYARSKWNGCAHILDLTYYLTNTQARSRGFNAGISSVIPDAEIVLSINAQSRSATSYQLTKDALTVYKNINIIFAINDASAWGAIEACKELNIDPEQMIVLPFGLEGDTLKRALMENVYCKAGLAMFPEIVGPVCVEAAIAAFNNEQLEPQLVTPYLILTAETLPQVYEQVDSKWHLKNIALKQKIPLQLSTNGSGQHPREKLPKRIGVIVPFSQHEWYQNLTYAMQNYAKQFNIDVENVDANQSLKDEVDLRRRAIARLAAEQVAPGEVILIDGGPIANYLAYELNSRDSLTIITNSIEVFDILRKNSANVTILTGGAFRHSSQLLVGPTAESALSELRADKSFITAAGISLNFGLSHTNISEVTIKQAMIRSAREVILLADHTLFGQESIVQLAPLSVINRLITDDALPASTRLELTKLGILILLANL